MTEINDFLNEFQKTIVTSIQKEKKDYFKSVIDELYDIAEKYNDYLTLNTPISDLTAHVQYGTGCKGMHRGYYCPSPIYDLIVGGCKRGRISNKLTKASKEYYQYYFDNSKKLIYINQFFKSSTLPYSTEIIIRHDNLEYGIVFHNSSKTIEHLARCEYKDSKIMNYAFVNYIEGISKDMMSMQYEEYEYANERLSRAKFYPGIVPMCNLYNKTEYGFIYDNNNKIVEYITKSEHQGQVIDKRYKVDM